MRLKTPMGVTAAIAVLAALAVTWRSPPDAPIATPSRSLAAAAPEEADVAPREVDLALPTSREEAIAFFEERERQEADKRAADPLYDAFKSAEERFRDIAGRWEPAPGQSLANAADRAACAELLAAHQQYTEATKPNPIYPGCETDLPILRRSRALQVCGRGVSTPMSPAIQACFEEHVVASAGTEDFEVWLAEAERGALDLGDRASWETLSQGRRAPVAGSKRLNRMWGSALSSYAPDIQSEVLGIAEDLPDGRLRNMAFSVGGHEACRRVDRGEFWCF